MAAAPLACTGVAHAADYSGPRFDAHPHCNEEGRLCPEWRALLLKFPGRFLIGSDAWTPRRWLSYDELMRGYRRWLGELPPEVARRVAWDNGAVPFQPGPP